jgi:Fem-1 family protein b
VGNEGNVCSRVCTILSLIWIAGVAEIILRTQTKLSLKCMAAKAVKNYNITYQGQVPHSLESFIELHGPGVKQG